LEEQRPRTDNFMKDETGRGPHDPGTATIETASVSDGGEPPTAIERARARWAAYELDLKPTEADGIWIGQCPTHRSLGATVKVEAEAWFDGPVTIHPCPRGCLSEEIARILRLTEHAVAPERLRRIKARINIRRFGGPDGATQYLRVVNALFAQGLDGRRSDVDGVRGEGRYECPVCGAKPDGHGLKVSQGDRQPVVLHCFACLANYAEIVAALGLSPADISRPLEELTVLDVEPDRPRELGDGAEVLDAVEAFLGRFVAYPSGHARVAHTLWIAHTHLMDAWDSTPRIAFLSPEPSSGKTRAIEVTELLVPNPIEAVNVTPAYLFRKVGECSPTILYDEIDTVFGPKAKENEEIRGLLNAGHRRGAVAGRCVVRGKIVETEEIPAYCAVALAGLGGLPDTLLSRSVVIRMRKRAPTEPIEQFRRRGHAPAGHKLRDRLATWADVIREKVTGVWPVMPDGVEDRDADVWEALLAVADAAGGDWPERARVAAVALVADSKRDTPSLGVLLLRDLRAVFGDDDQLATETVLDRLHGLDESPWVDLYGKSLNPRGLAQRLRQYGVHSKNVRIGESISKGYARSDLWDAWQRYAPVGVPPYESATSATSATEDR
jgi:hypothetical protein